MLISGSFLRAGIRCFSGPFPPQDVSSALLPEPAIPPLPDPVSGLSPVAASCHSQTPDTFHWGSAFLRSPSVCPRQNGSPGIRLRHFSRTLNSFLRTGGRTGGRTSWQALKNPLLKEGLNRDPGFPCTGSSTERTFLMARISSLLTALLHAGKILRRPRLPPSAATTRDLRRCCSASAPPHPQPQDSPCCPFPVS